MRHHSVEEKTKIIEDYQASGMRVKDYAYQFLEIHPVTFYKWLKKAGKLSKRAPRRTTAIDMDALEKDLKNYPQDTLIQRSKRLKANPVTIHYAIKRLKARTAN